MKDSKLHLWIRPRLPGRDSPESTESFEATAQVCLHFDCEDDGILFAIAILQGWTKSDHAIVFDGDVDLENLEEVVTRMQDALPEAEAEEGKGDGD